MSLFFSLSKDTPTFFSLFSHISPSLLSENEEVEPNSFNFFSIFYYFSQRSREERKLKAKKDFLIKFLEEVNQTASFKTIADPLKGGLAYYWYEEEIEPFGNFINQEGGVNELYKKCDKALAGPQHYKKFLDFPIDIPFPDDINEDSHFLRVDLENFFEEFPELKEYQTMEGTKRREEFLIKMREVIDNTQAKEELSEEEFTLRERYLSYLSYLFGDYVQRCGDYKIFRFGYFNRLKECNFLEKNVVPPEGIALGHSLLKKAFSKKVIDEEFFNKLVNLLNEKAVGIFSKDNINRNIYLKSRKYFTVDDLKSIIKTLVVKEENKG